MFLLLIVVIVLPAVASDDKQYTALHFGASANDYIGFKFNMAPFQDSFSICTWIKRVDTSASHPLVFDYEPSSPNNEILIGSNGIYNKFVGDGDLYGKHSVFTTPVGSWFNYCITWSLASRSTNLYLDGHLVGSGTTDSGRTLKMGGTLYFNRLSYSRSSSHIFGGQLYQFNIFSKALSSADVKKIADGGMCMDLTEFRGTGDLRWEYILSQSRSGSVREVEIEIDDNDMNCYSREKLLTLLRRSQERLTNVTDRLNETESQLSGTEETLEIVTETLNTTLKELGDVRGELNSTEEKLDVVTMDLNKTVATMASVIEQLNSTQEELGTTNIHLNSTQEQLNTTREELVTVKGKLNSTQEELNSTQEELGSVKSELNSTQGELDTTQEELGTVKGKLERTESELQTESAQHNKTGEQLDTCSTSLTSTLTQLESARTFHNITRWDVLFTTPYFNKVLTEELFQQLSSSWGMLGKCNFLLLLTLLITIHSNL